MMDKARSIVRPLEREDFAAAATAREISKTVFDLLKNLILLGALKYVAEKSKSLFLDGVYWFACAFFIMLCMSYIQPWRLRVISAIWRTSSVAHGIDVAINSIALIILQIWIFIYLQRIVENLVLAH